MNEATARPVMDDNAARLILRLENALAQTEQMLMQAQAERDEARAAVAQLTAQVDAPVDAPVEQGP